jgi:diaminopimelate epimerase
MGNRKGGFNILTKAIKFWKVEAAGNDFVMIDNRISFFNTQDKALISRLCHRRFGVGADGLIEVTKPQGYDFEMKYFNSDGSGPVMCGNGARAAVLFAKNRGFFQNHEINFLAPDGEHFGDLSDDNIKLSIKQPETIQDRSDEQKAFFIDTGTNHIVIPMENLSDLPIEKVAPPYRYKHDSNINYIEQINGGVWQIRTWERGVEDETYACGTGATACAYYINKIENIDFPITLKAKGGNLIISKKDNKLWLQGPANEVFEGQFNL